MPEDCEGSRTIYPKDRNKNLTVVKSGGCEGWAAGRFSLDGTTARAQASNGMARSQDTDELSWPWWAPWALLAVAATSVLTIGATLYDIL